MKTRFLLFSSVLLLFLLANFLILEPSIRRSYAYQQNPELIEVVLKRIYLDGEISEEYVEETNMSMEDIWSKYDKWQLIKKEKDELVFQQMVDDISPLMKTNGYFGISNDGILTIFNGKPEKANIIQSFFQLDLEKLETKQHQNLQKGIPVKSKDNYVEVLETFKNFTITNQAK